MILSIFNQKGGVAKTTTAVNLGAALAGMSHYHKVLIVDSDPQANTTVSLGINDEELELSLYELMSKKGITKGMIQKAIIETKFPHIDCLPCDITLSEAEITLSNSISRETILSRILEQVRDDYDIIIIDSPPSLGLLSVNTLVACDYLIVPVSPSFFSIKGIKHLIDTVNLIQNTLKPELEIMGVLITKFDSRIKLSKNIKEILEGAFGDKVFKTIIRLNSAVEYSQDHQQPVIIDKPKSNASKDYIALAREVMDLWQKVEEVKES